MAKALQWPDWLNQYVVYLNGVAMPGERYTWSRTARKRAQEVWLATPWAWVQVRLVRDGKPGGVVLTLPQPVDCKVGPWGPWIPTSDWERVGDEESRIEQRVRRVKIAPAYGGEPAPNLWDIQRVTRSAAPINCALGTWSDWYPVTGWGECADGTQSRKEQRVRAVETPPENGGTACGPMMEERTVSQPCTGALAPVDCVVSPWSEWKAITAWGECVAGAQARTEARVRAVATEPANGGTYCGPLLQLRAIAQPCAAPVNCVLDEWSPWMPIDNWSACVNRRQLRTEARVRDVLTPPASGGMACGALLETRIVAQDCVAAVTPTPDGTRIPPAGQIVNPLGDVYTMVPSGTSYHVHKNGKWYNGGTGTELLGWNQGLVYVLSENGNWYRDDISQWTNVGPDDPQHGPKPPPVSTGITRGRINAGSNELTVASLLDLKVGDTVGVCIGKEPGQGKRGSRGVGGNWPTDDMGFASFVAMTGRYGEKPNPSVFCFINTAGPDFGKVFWGNSAGWIEMSRLNWSNISNSGEYYNALLTPRSLQAEITAIDVPAKRLTLARGPTNGVAKVSVVDAVVVKDFAVWLNDALNKGSVTLPAGDIAICSQLHINNQSALVLEGQGRDSTRLYSPPGFPCLTVDSHNSPGTIIRDLTAQGNWRDHGFGHNYGDCLTPAWGAVRGVPPVDNHSYPGGAGPTVGLRFNNGCNDSRYEDVLTIDLATQHIGASFCERVWGLDVEMRYSDPLRQYMQWAALWADTTGGGCRRVKANFKYVTPGFESFKAQGVLFEDCGGTNCMLSSNGASQKVVRYRATFDENALVQCNMGANVSQPLVNIGTAIGIGFSEQGNVYSQIYLEQKGYLFGGHTSMIAFKGGDRNKGVVLEDFENYAPKYKEGGIMHGAQAVDSAAPGFILRRAKLYGTAYWTEANGAANRAVVFTLNANAGGCVDVACVDDPKSKFIW